MLVMIAEKHLGYSGVSSAFDKIPITFGKNLAVFQRKMLHWIFKEECCTGYETPLYIATDGSATTWRRGISDSNDVSYFPHIYPGPA